MQTVGSRVGGSESNSKLQKPLAPEAQSLSACAGSTDDTDVKDAGDALAKPGIVEMPDGTRLFARRLFVDEEKGVCAAFIVQGEAEAPEEASKAGITPDARTQLFVALGGVVLFEDAGTEEGDHKDDLDSLTDELKHALDRERRRFAHAISCRLQLLRRSLSEEIRLLRLKLGRYKLAATLERISSRLAEREAVLKSVAACLKNAARSSETPSVVPDAALFEMTIPVGNTVRVVPANESTEALALRDDVIARAACRALGWDAAEHGEELSAAQLEERIKKTTAEIHEMEAQNADIHFKKRLALYLALAWAAGIVVGYVFWQAGP